MLFALFICVIINFLMIEICLHEKQRYINLINSPLGTEFTALITAHNHNGTGSTGKCNGKLDCLQKICVVNKLPNFDYIQLKPMSRWLGDCNSTAENSMKSISWNKNPNIRVLLALGIITLILIFCCWTCRTIGIEYWYIPLLFTSGTYTLPFAFLTSVLIELINDAKMQPESIILGTGYYDKIYGIILITTYVFIQLLFPIQVAIHLIQSYCIKSKDKIINDRELDSTDSTIFGSIF